MKMISRWFTLCMFLTLPLVVAQATVDDQPTPAPSLFWSMDAWVHASIRHDSLLSPLKEVYWTIRESIAPDTSYFYNRWRDLVMNYEEKRARGLCTHECPELIRLRAHENRMKQYMERGTLSPTERTLLISLLDSQFIQGVSTTNNSSTLRHQEREGENESMQHTRKSPLTNETYETPAKGEKRESDDAPHIGAPAQGNETYHRLRESYGLLFRELTQEKNRWVVECRLFLNQSIMNEENHTSALPPYREREEVYRIVNICQNMHHVERLLLSAEEKRRTAERIEAEGDYERAAMVLTDAIADLKKASLMFTQPNPPFLSQNYTDTSPFQPPDEEHIINQTEIVPEEKMNVSPSHRIVKDDCVVAGCSSELCVSKEEHARGPIASICLYKPEYRCLAFAVCERQAQGRCGWTYTHEYQRCIRQIKP